MGRPTAMEAINTPEFLARLGRSDRDAVDILFREHAGTMMDFLQKRKRRHGLSEDRCRDVVQEVFIKLLTKPPNFDPSRKIGPLLNTMVLNEARDQAKMDRRRVAREEEVAKQTHKIRTAAGGESIASRLVAAEERSFVENKLRQMSGPDQQALAAFVQNGPNRHIASLAAATGASTGATQMRFQRAKERWRDSVENKDSRGGNR